MEVYFILQVEQTCHSFPHLALVMNGLGESQHCGLLRLYDVNLCLWYRTSAMKQNEKPGEFCMFTEEYTQL